MVRAALTAALLALAAPAGATQDGWPALYDVTGVAADDVLNIRAEPSPEAQVVGRFAPDARGIEVIRPTPRETWGLVNTGEGTGWVSLAYLARRPGQWYGRFPAVAACFGTEPFWSLRPSPAGDAPAELVLSRPDAPPLRFRVTGRTGSASRRDRSALFAAGEAGPAALRLGLGACSDGMSDRAYGIDADLMIGDGEGLMLSGCCSLAPEAP